MKIFIDMDDVVADWKAAVEEFLKLKFPDNNQWARIPNEKWQELKNYGRFYRDLPIKPGGNELVEYILQYAAQNPQVFVAFLTAVPKKHHMQWAYQDKVHWGNQKFPGIPVFFGPYSDDKHKHCTGPRDILIDDKLSNCNEWIAAGGLSHQYKNWETCKIWLEEVL